MFRPSARPVRLRDHALVGEPAYVPLRAPGAVEAAAAPMPTPLTAADIRPGMRFDKERGCWLYSARWL